MHNFNQSKILTSRNIISDVNGGQTNIVGGGSSSTSTAVTLAVYCNYVTLENYDLSGAETVDGESPSNGNRILVANQTDASENGIYTYSSSGAWERVDGLSAGNQITILGGTKQGTIWVVETASFVIGTDNISIIESSISRKDESFSLGFDAVSSLMSMDKFIVQSSDNVLRVAEINDIQGKPTYDNLLINSNFRIWQRVATKMSVISRERTSYVVTIETERPHGYSTSDEVEIYNMGVSNYDGTYTITVVDSTHFTYPSYYADEANTAESTAHCVPLNKTIMSCDDEDFFADRWYSLREGGYSLASPQTSLGGQIKTTTIDKFGIVQIVTAKELESYLDSSFSLSIDAKSSGTSKCKLALLSWGGTKDSPTKDVVNVWGATDTNPTMVTNWTMEDVTDFMTLTTSLQTLTLENVTLTSGAKNVALFLWIENAVADEIVSFNNAQVLPATTIVTYSNENYFKELNNCYKFYQKSYARELCPFGATENGTITFPTSFGTDSGGYYGTIQIERMYKVPAVTLVSGHTTPKEGYWWVSTSSNQGVQATNNGDNSFSVENTEGYTISVKSIAGHYIAEAEI